ncbi:YhjD/YihY/BrkB family envelope integrity protein [uncultured Thiohalocapsa sp.]|uniref:YhjD/YihY/BrkB family envelope integrity protein n=1 Tax=uncultured Thiohalocapsa sp. TaxID=768990 RepID=UPI0025F21704|nr:YhjD/YihY/BrkB family envelope integrity protein [uncultured Thiohalocapsa sp.]
MTVIGVVLGEDAAQGRIAAQLPDKQVNWREVLPGALVTALMLSAGRYGIAAFLSSTAIASAYGAAASLLVVLMWVYFSALLLLLGAALTRASLRDVSQAT